MHRYNLKHLAGHIFRKTICRAYTNQQQHKSYYDILNLKPNCTSQEIKDSFIKLSKKFHPDVNKRGNDPKANSEYLEIMQAYSVLSKWHAREAYDYNLQSHGKQWTPVQNNTDGPLYTRNHSPGPYYGVEGLKKVSNMKIVVIILFFATIGVIFEMYLVRNSITFRRDRLEEISAEAGLQHANVRADAKKYGNQEQLQRMTERILKRSNES